jgi:hypothetical protein
MAKQLTLTNDAAGSNDVIHYFHYNVAGNLTAATGAPFGVMPRPGKIVSYGFGVQTYPATSDRTLAVTVKKISGASAAATVSTTEGTFAATAGGTGQKSTFVGGTGIVAPVLSTGAAANFVAGDQLEATVAVAGANGTIGTGLSVIVGVVFDAA